MSGEPIPAQEFVKCSGRSWIKDAVNNKPDAITILLLSIMWNHYHCIGGRLIVQSFLRREETRTVLFIILKVWLAIFQAVIF